MSVEKRQTKQGTVYDVRLRTPDGRQLSKTFKTRRQAEAFHAEQRTDLARGTWLDSRRQSISFGAWALEWLGHDPSKRPTTLARDDSILRNHLLPVLATRSLGSVVPRDIQAIVNSWVDGRASNTVRRQYDVLRAVFAVAVEMELIARTPCRGIKLPSPEVPERRIPTPAELGRLATEVGVDWEPMLWLGALLGLRWGECAGLRVSRIDFIEKKINIVEQVTRAAHGLMVAGVPKSKAGSRSLSAPDGLLLLLKGHIERRGLDADALLFTEADGGFVDYSNWRSRVWVPACKRAGLAGLVFHDMRRTNATVLVAQGVDLKTAQTRLGHSDPRLTLAVYAQATTAADRSAADRIAEQLMGSPHDTAEVAEVAESGSSPQGIAQQGIAQSCAINVRCDSTEPVAESNVIPLTRAKRSREGGIRTRDLSVPNAAR